MSTVIQIQGVTFKLVSGSESTDRYTNYHCLLYMWAFLKYSVWPAIY